MNQAYNPRLLHRILSPLRKYPTISYFSSTSTPEGCYATVNHAKAYEEAMAGRHGKQLSLAYKESKRVEDKVKIRNYYKNLLIEEERQANGEGVELLESNDDDDEYDDDDDDDEEEMVVSDQKHLTPALKAAYKAGAPSGSKFAIIRLAKSSQFKITIDDVIICNKLKPTSYYAVGAVLTIPSEDILLVGDCNKTNVGLPFVQGAEVVVRVEEITHDKTVIVFKKRRRKNSKRKNGHRRDVTFLRILDIRFPGEGVEGEGDTVVAA